MALNGFALAALLGLSMASPFAQIALKVNQMNSTWTAAVPHGLIDPMHIRSLCGTFLKGHPHYEALPELEDAAALSASDLPETFSWVERRPDCPSLRLVRDQSACGSCWAFSSTESFNDRRCIKYNDTRIFSSEDTLSCCAGMSCGLSQGCNGGQPTSALRWMAHTGVVTGAGYETIGDGKTCLPYAMVPCAHHIKPSDKYPACPDSYHSPRCKKACSETAYPKPYSADKTSGTKAYSVRGIKKIMADLYENGPLSVAIMVYEDFPTYASGVYSYVHGAPLGGHAVELVGWGTEGGVPYWLIKNSWNDMWGLKGYIKMRRGVNECGVEDSVSGILV